MTTEYQDSIREGFENHIAKQLRLEDVHKDVLAVQVFAMNKKLEYADKKLQKKWGEWNAACSQQIEKDVNLRHQFTSYNHTSKENQYVMEYSEAIRNQV